MKGANDGGLSVPHSETRFPGWDKEANEGEGELDAGVHRGRIFGEHISANMSRLQDEDGDAYTKQYSQYIKNGLGPDKLEAMYQSAQEETHPGTTPSPAQTAHRCSARDQTGLSMNESP